jgi:hypothetical protein
MINNAKNTMMSAAPNEKSPQTQYHFASDGRHYAQVVMAATVAEATEIYHKTKKLLVGASPTPSVVVGHADVINKPEPPEQSDEGII